MTSVILGDDHAVFLNAMEAALRHAGFQVTATATNVPDTVTQNRLHQPDMCLLDKHFPGYHALDVIGDIRTVSSHTRIVILSADRDMAGADSLLRAGACGYVHKSRGLHALLSAIERIQRGHTVVDIPTSDTRHLSGEADDARRLAAQLTARERECLRMLVDGLDTTDIVAQLGVAPTTVRTHVQSVLSKLCVHSRLEAASFAVRYGIVDEEESPCYPAIAEGRYGNQLAGGYGDGPHSGLPAPVS